MSFSFFTAIRRASAVACVLVAGFAASHATPVAADAVSYIYGIDDNNVIWELNPIGQTATPVFTAQGQLGISGSANSNAFAYDNTRENMLFLNGSGTSSTLYVWNKPTNSLSIAATAAQLGLVSGSNQQPANAAYNSADGGYYFFEDGTSDLYKIDFTYSGAIPTFSNRTVTTVGAGYANFSYGDIVIDPTSGSGVLYGSATSGDFFSVDLADPANSYNNINNTNGLSPTTGLQLSFNTDYTQLYGHVFSTAAWYVVNTNDGTVGSSIWTSPVAFRDLGGASLTQSAVPEIDPAAFGGVLALVMGSLGLLERRRMAAAA